MTGYACVCVCVCVWGCVNVCARTYTCGCVCACLSIFSKVSTDTFSAESCVFLGVEREGEKEGEREKETDRAQPLGYVWHVTQEEWPAMAICGRVILITMTYLGHYTVW